MVQLARGAPSTGEGEESQAWLPSAHWLGFRVRVRVRVRVSPNPNPNPNPNQEAQRAAYRAALVAAHRQRDVRPFAGLVRECVARGWAALEAAWRTRHAAARSAAAGAQARGAREEARAADCAICLDAGPTCTV